ncbi:KIF-binding protein-like [Cylas formicarius]|uniref:KIF-binding protein-like n=1 Tax=Cylas formicarius TaxID=197179 RepID=UPI00295867E6|nr:KIF-binding protein-like [Cylas formicarius]
MEENISRTNDLEQCFNELKNLSLTYKLGPAPSTSGDEIRNPLHKQFELILSKIEVVLNNVVKNSEEYLRTICMKSSILYEKAKILLSENLLAEGNDMLEDSLKVISDYSEHPQVRFLYLRVMNHWTYVLSRIGHLEKAKDALTQIIVDENKQPEVFSTDDLFLNTKKDRQTSLLKLNRLTINNMQLLAWIYGKLGDTDAHLKAQHDILQRQLEFNEDVLKWAESCYKLSGMFIGNGDWENARYHLSAAGSVLKPLEISFVPVQDLHAVQADIARTWIYYGLQLFQTSTEIDWNMNSEPDGVVQDGDKGIELAPAVAIPKQTTLHTFKDLPVEVQESVPTVIIRTLSHAKALFEATYKWIKRARLYYSLRDYPLQFVNLGLDLSELYRFWSAYETDIDSQYMVQKRRYDALETLTAILKDVRPNCYAALLIELTKEIIEVQVEMMGLNLKKMFTPTDVPQKHINEDLTKRQMSAFASIHSKLEHASSYFETNSQLGETARLEKESELSESSEISKKSENDNENCIK